MRLVHFSEIDWDVDELEPGESAPELPPREVTLTVADDLDVAGEGADFLSDHYGWCVLGFQFEDVAQVEEADKCPKCGERGMDRLAWNEDCTEVRCVSCGTNYVPPAE